MLKRGILDLVIAAALWGSIGIAVQVGFNEGGSVFQMIFFRSFTASILSLPFIKRIGKLKAVLMGIIAVTFYETYVFTVSILGASLSAIFLYTAPAWVLVLSKFTNDKVTIRKVASSILVIIGVYLLYLTNIILSDILWGLMSGLTYALLIVYSRYMQKEFKDDEIIASQSIWSLPIAFFLMILYSPAVTLSSLWSGFYLGLVATFLAYYFFYRGMRSTDSIIASVITSLEPVFTIIFAMIFLHQFLTPLQFLGASIILLSAILISL